MDEVRQRVIIECALGTIRALLYDDLEMARDQFQVAADQVQTEGDALRSAIVFAHAAALSMGFRPSTRMGVLAEHDPGMPEGPAHLEAAMAFLPAVQNGDYDGTAALWRTLSLEDQVQMVWSMATLACSAIRARAKTDGLGSDGGFAEI